MNWRDKPIPYDDENRAVFKGLIELTNDKNEHLGGICWFQDDGPFYASAMDINDTGVIRRIGPCTTLEGAKRRVYEALGGLILDLNKRAGYRL